MALPVLPQDVFDEIIGQLPDETSILKSCSLVCRSFRRNAQKMLFNYTNVELPYNDSDNIAYYPGSQPIKLVLIVKHAPHLIEYIQELRISCFRDNSALDFDDSNTADLANALGVFSCKGEFPINLQSFSFKIDYLQWWDDWLKDALMLLMSVDSLRHIFLDGILECPANIFQNLPLLEHLTLTNTTFSSLPASQIELPKLESLTCFAIRGRDGLDQISNIMNTSQLKTFEGGLCTPSTMPMIERILRPTSNSLEHLTFLDFNITDPDSVSINLNWFSRLTDVTIYQTISSKIPPMLILITKTMKNISHRNVIRNLEFHLELIDIVGFESATNDLWQEVDTIWSIPQLVSSESFRGITFSIHSTARKCDALSSLIQNKLPKTNKAGKLHIKTSLFSQWFHCNWSS